MLPCIVASVKWGTPGTDVVHLFYLLACVCCSKSYDLLSCDHARRGVVFVSERFLRKKMERWRPFWRAGVSAARSIELWRTNKKSQSVWYNMTHFISCDIRVSLFLTWVGEEACWSCDNIWSSSNGCPLTTIYTYVQLWFFPTYGVYLYSRSWSFSSLEIPSFYFVLACAKVATKTGTR